MVVILRRHPEAYDAAWQTKIMVEVLVDVNNNSGKDCMQGDWNNDGAVYRAFDEAKSQRPPGHEHNVSE